MGPGSAPALFGPTLRCPSREIQAMEPPPVPMVSMSIIGMRTGNGPTEPPLVNCGMPFSIRLRSVDVPPASRVTTSLKPARAEITALPSTPAAGPERAVVMGFATTCSALMTPPFDCITRNGF
jgi:hypothetical protein